MLLTLIAIQKWTCHTKMYKNGPAAYPLYCMALKIFILCLSCQCCFVVISVILKGRVVSNPIILTGYFQVPDNDPILYWIIQFHVGLTGHARNCHALCLNKKRYLIGFLMDDSITTRLVNWFLTSDPIITRIVNGLT